MKEILLFEDNPALMSSRVRTLENEGYEVTTASSAKEAAKSIKYSPYDLVIIEADMPEAVQIASQIMAPLLLIVDEGKAGSIAQSLPLGMWAFLVKPFTAGQLIRAVAEALGKSNAINDSIRQWILLPFNSTGKLPVSEAETSLFFKRIVEIIAAQTEADRVSLLIADDKSGKLEAKVELGPRTGDREEEMANWVIRTGQVLVANERTRADPLVQGIMADLGASSLLCVPLLTKDKAIGAIHALKTTKGRRFADANVEFVTVLAKQVAIAIENAFLFRSVENQRQEQERLLSKAVQSHENERKRVAAEIHDGVGQQIIAALYRVQAFSSFLSQSKLEEARIEAEEVRLRLAETARELRRVLADLRPHILDELGLVSAVREAVERLGQETNIASHFTTEGNMVGLTPEQDAAIYRIVQEAITNIRKHACATEARVEFHFGPDAVLVRVSDNGKGFELEQDNEDIPIGHMGLLGMKERAEMLGGTLNIGSQPGKGTEIVLKVPVKSYLRSRN